MLDQLSLVSDELTEAMLEEKVTPELHPQVASARRTIALKCTPVMMGSALGNKAVQLLLDGVCNYLPDPRDVENIALDLVERRGAGRAARRDPTKPLVMLAFKLEDGRYGQLTYIRVYQGTIRKDDFIVNSRNGKKVKVGRLVRMHSDDKEDITEAGAGDICALFGVDCNSGDTFTDGTRQLRDDVDVRAHAGDLGRRSSRRTPAPRSTCRRRSTASPRRIRRSACYVDPESNETIIAGMGELHLDVYIERMKREYKAEVVTVAAAGRLPRDDHARRSSSTTPTRSRPVAPVSTASVAGYVEPFDGDFEFDDEIKGGAIPREFIPSCEKGFKSMIAKSPRLGVPVVGLRVAINDGQRRTRSTRATSRSRKPPAARSATSSRARSPKILEPIMKVSLEGPAEFSGNMLSA